MADGRRGMDRPLLLLLAVVLLASTAYFWLCWRYDNKYTRPRPEAAMGVVRLNMDWYDETPFFYLADSWSFYKNRLLSPDEISGAVPDAYLYIGQYGGFDLGDPAADPHGRATYRTVILTDGAEREYALELTEIFSRWRLWINGRLMQSVGFADGDAPAPGSQMVTFSARDQIEIVVAVEDDRGIYSGMVYPPAFGSPREVERAGLLRLLIHGAACSAALLIGLLCLMARFLYRFSIPYGALALLCLCFCACTGWPIYQALGLQGGVWPLLERLGSYGIYPTLIWLQGRVTKLPRRAYHPACAAGAAVCLGILLVRLLPARRAGLLMAWAGLLTAYKWLTVLWMLAACCWALRRGRRYSRAVLSGNCIFACALAMGKLFPLHEPILLGWFPEQAGGFLILLAGGILCRDTARVSREHDALRAQRELMQVQLEARAEQARLSQEYVRRTREQLHETRSRFTLVRYYLDCGELKDLSDFVDSIVQTLGDSAPQSYTGHGLTDAVLAYQFSRAANSGVYVEPETDLLPQALPIDDSDLTSLLMNLLDNAIEGCERTEPSRRWIYFAITRQENELRFLCRNSAPLDAGAEGNSSKEDQQAHGFGLPLLRKISARYGGEVTAGRAEECFTVEVRLRMAKALEVPAPIKQEATR